jgi:hypothetical protein
VPYDAVDVALVEAARNEAQHEAEAVVREQVLTQERRDDSVPNHTQLEHANQRDGATPFICRRHSKRAGRAHANRDGWRSKEDHTLSGGCTEHVRSGSRCCDDEAAWNGVCRKVSKPAQAVQQQQTSAAVGET